MLAGDFNIDLLKLNSNTKYQEFYDSLAEFDFLPIITLPTRISKRNATLIDHMYCKSPNPLTISESGRGDRGWLSHGLVVTLPISYSLDGGTLWGFTRDMRIAD